jgi:predicted N-formylglutamate amidohydrolase
LAHGIGLYGLDPGRASQGRFNAPLIAYDAGMNAAPDAAASPYELVNPQGRARLLLVCDHASRELPAEYGTLGLDKAELWRHIACDIGAADVTRRLAELLDAPALLAGYSRLLVDCNRSPDDPTFICAISDGTAIPGNSDIGADEVARRRARYFTPYHAAIDEQLRLRSAAAGAAPALIAIHSFTPVMNGFERPWHAGVLWDRDGRIALPLIKMLAADTAIVVGDNEPYSGRGFSGYTTRRHAESVGLPSVLIEIRQNLIDTQPGVLAWADRLAAALGLVLPGVGAAAVAK